MMSPKDKKFLKEFGKHLKRLRIEKGFTIRDFADEADIAYSALSKLEAGQMNPSLIVLLKVADALGVDLNKLVPKK